MAISRMQQPQQMQGGIGSLQDPRQGYFLGKLVKKAGRAVKQVVKSPLGKMALIGGLGYGLGGAKFLGGKGIFAGGQGLGRFANLKNLFTSQNTRELVAKHLYNHAIKEYSEKIILDKWIDLINFNSN